MRISFHIDYHTLWGENLAIEFGDGHGVVPMSPSGVAGQWKATVEISSAEALKGIDYNYILMGSEGEIARREWRGHTLPSVDQSVSELDVKDKWNDRPADLPYYSTLFTECVSGRGAGKRDSRPTISGSTITLEFVCTLVPADCSLAIVGSIAALGNWAPQQAVRCNDSDLPHWSVSFPAEGLSGEIEYKIILIKSATGEIVKWEPGDNRRLYIDQPLSPDSALIISIEQATFVDAEWRGAGVAIPVFSLRSNDDFGVGDFVDLRKMGDWAALTGQKIIQILPINDTNTSGHWTDSYPYNAVSSFALHPLYLRLEEAGELRDDARRSYFQAKKQELQSLPVMDYEQVYAAKIEYMRELYAQDGRDTVAREDFQEFVEDNSDWLKPYAAYCVIRDMLGTADIRCWGELSSYEAAKVEAIVDGHADEVNFIYFLQYHLDRQLRRTRDYLHSIGVAIKGDIPIGISRTSMDAWLNPGLYNLDASAGAPPDDFAITGQNWGFPTYNWEAMARDSFRWWKDRFRTMARYIDAYRIDHVLGFFRIWQIPVEQTHGLLGVFNPALPFTAEELHREYGFELDPEMHCRPYITDESLRNMFGEEADEVSERFFRPVAPGRYALKPEWANQRSIAEWGEKMPADSSERHLVAPLQGLIDQVLFLPDPNQKDKWHPRILGHQTEAYTALSDDQKSKYDHLYHDFFYRRNDDLWRDKAMAKLPEITESTSMLACAEDLGMIPACVPSVMEALRILSLEIQRMPKEYGCRFGDPSRYPYLSVCATSTHDMPGIRGWWEQSHALREAFMKDILGLDSPAPDEAEPWICEKIIDSHFASPSMLCILPLQDYLSIDGDLRRANHREEVINDPANPRHYWQYRMHLNLEELLKAEALNSRLQSKIASFGR